jgi:hypothetical protein
VLKILTFQNTDGVNSCAASIISAPFERAGVGNRA